MPTFAIKRGTSWRPDCFRRHRQIRSEARSYSGLQVLRNLLHQPLLSAFFASCPNSPQSSQTPPHVSQVSMATPSNWDSSSFPSHLGHFIEEFPDALACSETAIFDRNFSISSWF